MMLSKILKICSVWIFALHVVLLQAAEAQGEDDFRVSVVGNGKADAELRNFAGDIVSFLRDSAISAEVVNGGYPLGYREWYTRSPGEALWGVSYDSRFRKLRVKGGPEPFAPIISLNEADNHEFHREFLYWDKDDSVIRLGIGWVPYDKESVKEIDECDPQEEWPEKQCVEKIADDEFIVKMKFGHEGFPVMELAANRFAFDGSEGEFAFDRSVEVAEAIVSQEFFNRIADSWLITAVPIKRNVEFHLYLPGETRPHRRASGEKARPGKRGADEKEREGVYNTCGGLLNACPIFYDPNSEEDWKVFLEDMRLFGTLSEDSHSGSPLK